jgi:uncharacterized membrane protein
MWWDDLGCCLLSFLEEAFWFAWWWVLVGIAMIGLGIWMLTDPELRIFGLFLIAGGIVVLVVGARYTNRREL